MSTLNHKKGKHDDELIKEVNITREILFKRAEKSQILTEKNKNSGDEKVFYLRIPMEAHIIALIKDGLS